MIHRANHLSANFNATLLAFHSRRNIAAWRDKDGKEVLVIDGQDIRLDPRIHHSPVQMTINLVNFLPFAETP